MTKEQLELEFEDCFDECTDTYTGIYDADITNQSKLWRLFSTKIDEFTKQQSIAFAIHYAKSAIQNGYVKPSAVENDRMEERYNQFIEQQNKDNGKS